MSPVSQLSALFAFHEVMVADLLLPGASGEVGDFDGGVAVGYGNAAELAQARPFGGVVDVLVQGQAVEQAVDEAVVHDVVHATVAAYLAGHLLGLDLDGVLVLEHQRLLDVLWQEIVHRQVLVIGHSLEWLDLAQAVALHGVLVGEAVGAGELVHAGIWTRVHDVVLYVHGLAGGGLDHGHGMVGVLEAGALALQLLLDELGTGYGLGVHGHQVSHAVATVQVDKLRGRTHAVGGVDVTAVALVEVEAPVALVCLPEGLEVMYIAALDVQDVAEEALLGHVEGGELEEVVDAVLEHHAVAAGLLGGVDKLPAFVEIHGSGHFHGHVLAVFHGVDGHGDVVLPVGGDVYDVDVGAFAELFPALLAAILGGGGASGVLQVFLRLGQTLGVLVAQGLDGGAVDIGPAIHGARAAHAQADEAHAHTVHGGGAEVNHVGSALRTGRYLGLDGCGGCRNGAKAQRQHQDREYGSFHLVSRLLFADYFLHLRQSAVDVV